MGTINLTGHIANEPRLEFTRNGNAVFNIDIAETHWRKDAQGNFLKAEDCPSTFYNVTVWKEKAQLYADSGLFTKGTKVALSGKFETEDYTDKHGKRGKNLNIIADDIGVVPKSPRQDKGNYQAPVQQPVQQVVQQNTGFGAQPVQQSLPQPTQQADPWATPQKTEPVNNAPF